MGTVLLTHLSRMELPTLLSRMSPLPILAVLGGIFPFFQVLDPDQMPHFAASDLGLHYLPMSHKKDVRLIQVKTVLLSTQNICSD